MKKTYQNPETDVMQVALCNVIAASPLNLDETGGEYTLTDEQAPEGIAAGTRRRDLWEDEEEEELY